MRVSKFNGRDDLVHNSVHDFDKNKNNELEQLSVNGHQKHNMSSQDHTNIRKSHNEMNSLGRGEED